MDSTKYRKSLMVTLDHDFYPPKCHIWEWDEATGKAIVISDGSGGAGHDQPGPYSIEVSVGRLRSYLERWEQSIWQRENAEEGRNHA